MRKACLIVLAGAALGLAGCSARMFDQLPQSVGGLPADAPKAPATPYVYPAVHDMPAPRAVKPLTDDEQMRLEKDLLTARDSQEKTYGAASGKKQPDDKAGSAAKP